MRPFSAPVKPRKPEPPGRCLSCGATEGMGRRRYCSVECRQKLRFSLNLRTGLLRALNARYATFYFTEALIVLDVLPLDRQHIASFIHRRSANRKPAADFSRMADLLGNIWWAEKNRSNKRYLASRQVLSQARSHRKAAGVFGHIQRTIPSVRQGALIQLQLSAQDLAEAGAESMIKSAFRQQAKIAHPDLGGDAATFRRLRRAYSDLLDWAANPTFTTRKGFVDRWFYEYRSNRWIQPAPAPPANGKQ